MDVCECVMLMGVWYDTLPSIYSLIYSTLLTLSLPCVCHAFYVRGMCVLCEFPPRIGICARNTICRDSVLLTQAAHNVLLKAHNAMLAARNVLLTAYYVLLTAHYVLINTGMECTPSVYFVCVMCGMYVCFMCALFVGYVCVMYVLCGCYVHVMCVLCV